MAELNYRKRGQKWEYRFEGAKVDGKRKQFSKGGFTTKKECVEAGTKALAEYNAAGICFTPSELSVADYLDNWFDNYCKMNLKYNTQLNYIQIIEKHLKPTFGKFKLQSLNAAAIQEYTNNLKKQGYSKSHTVGIITTLSGALNYAIEPLNYITNNPCARIKYPKFEKTEKNDKILISTADFKKILERFPDSSPFYIPLLIGYYTGMRISEVFALTWDDIDFDTQTITVSKTTVKRNYNADIRDVLKTAKKSEQHSAWYFNTPKTQSSYRTVKIGMTLLNALKKAHLKKKKNSLLYGEYYIEQYVKEEPNENGDIIKRIISIQKCIPCDLPKIELVCTRAFLKSRWSYAILTKCR